MPFRKQVFTPFVTVQLMMHRNVRLVQYETMKLPASLNEIKMIHG